MKNSEKPKLQASLGSFSGLGPSYCSTTHCCTHIQQNGKEMVSACLWDYNIVCCRISIVKSCDFAIDNARIITYSRRETLSGIEGTQLAREELLKTPEHC